METLTQDDLLMTADNREVPFKRVSFTLEKATKVTAPYKIEPHAFGINNPSKALCISPLHAIMMNKNVWVRCADIAWKNPRINQYGIGEPITYYHMECPNYATDHLVAEGLVVESFRDTTLAKPSKVVRR